MGLGWLYKVAKPRPSLVSCQAGRKMRQQTAADGVATGAEMGGYPTPTEVMGGDGVRWAQGLCELQAADRHPQPASTLSRPVWASLSLLPLPERHLQLCLSLFLFPRGGLCSPALSFMPFPASLHWGLWGASLRTSSSVLSISRAVTITV